MSGESLSVSGESLANRKVGVVLQGDPNDPRSWSGIPYGLTGGLREAGAASIAIDARAPAATSLAARLRVPWTRQTTSPLLSRLGGARASRALSRQRPDAAIAIGSGYQLSGSVPFATYDDMTVVQAIAQLGSTYEAVSPRASRRWIERQQRGYEASSACCAASAWAAESIVNDYGIDPAKIHVVGFGRNMPMREVDRDWSIPRFIFIGNDWERKRGQAVVEAFAAVRGVHRSATLDLVGAHPPIDTPGVTGHDPLPLGSEQGQGRLAELLERATCLVMPSRFEPFGIAHLDAAASGVPSIGTTNGGAADAIGPGGVLVDPDDSDALLDAMVEFCNPQVAREVGDRAFSHAVGLNWKSVALRICSSLNLVFHGA